ncbi:MAG: hypothetical protein WAK60_00825 [Sedimentisphaerales bacterium]
MGALVAYGLFQFLGKKWIENKFAEKLQEYKHAQNKELEELKFRINTLFSRVTKIHEKEFEVLPEAWLKMQEALGRASQLVSLIREYPDLNRMSKEALSEFLAQSKLHDYEKKELLEASNKLAYYQDTIFWYELRETREAFWDFHNYIIKYRVFLSSNLQEQFGKIDDVIWEAIVERKVGHEANDREMWSTAYKKIRDEINPIRDKIETLVQSRLHYDRVD